MEQAINKAIKGGYGKGMVFGKNATKFDYEDYLDIPTVSFENRDRFIEKAIDTVLIDPLFWQALGKQQGWYDHQLRGKHGECLECGAPQCAIEWRENWHYFIDHLADGGNVDDFFNKLLK